MSCRIFPILQTGLYWPTIRQCRPRRSRLRRRPIPVVRFRQLSSIQLAMWDWPLPSPLIRMATSTFPTGMVPMTTSSMQRIRPALGSPFRLTQQDMWEPILQLLSIPTMLSTFPTMIQAMATSSMPPVQAAVQPQAIGTLSPLTQQGLWEPMLQLLSIPTMHCTFPTTMIPMTTSSMPPVQAAAQPRAIGTRSPLTQQDMWGVSLQSPSIPTMLSTFPTWMLPITTSSMPPVQAAAQPRAIGTKSPLTQQGLWGITPQSPLIPTMHCTFPTTSLPMTTSSTPRVQAVVQLQAIGTRSPLTQQEMWGITPQSPLIPTMLSTFPT